MSRRAFLSSAFLILALACVLRGLWLTADPPSTNGVGIVWHDEGAWVHNARNRVLWGAWRMDEWNPVFIAPVFTGLEYAAFSAFGVGTWQARLVPVVSGLAAVAFLIAGVNAAAGRRAAALAGALLAINYPFVMWNRAALMESTMTAFIVVAWAAYALAARQPRWGLVAGAAGLLAFFVKASAAFFVAALVLDIAVTFVLGRRGVPAPPGAAERNRGGDAAGAAWTLAGLAIAVALVGVAFVLPNWTDFRFYNWQMTVTRKPEYTIDAFMIRASWLPLVHDFFTWMWPVFVAGCAAVVRIGAGWQTARPSERLLALWILIGLLELVVHDSGNERRYVMFIPAIIALAAERLAGRNEPLPGIDRGSARARAVAALLTLPLGYLAAGSAVRVLFLDRVRAGDLHTTVVLSAAAAVVAASAVLVAHRVNWAPLARWRLPVALAAVTFTAALDLRHLTQFAGDRQELNYRASVDVGRLLAPGTLVQGKLANGLSLDNQIRPVFIGHGFGNFADRLQRDDVRYILTYVFPSVGFESQAGSGLIQEILDRYPHHRAAATFAVSDGGGQPGRAALIDKLPGTEPRAPD